MRWFYLIMPGGGQTRKVRTADFTIGQTYTIDRKAYIVHDIWPGPGEFTNVRLKLVPTA
jgi:hypothetical protein